MIFTADECREKAADKLAQAARNIGHRRNELQNAAEAWRLLASKIDDTPSETASDGSLFQPPPCGTGLSDNLDTLSLMVLKAVLLRATPPHTQERPQPRGTGWGRLWETCRGGPARIQERRNLSAVPVAER
jgi:hypothetical protein